MLLPKIRLFSLFFALGITAELFGQVDVFDGKQAKIHVIVERFCTNDLLTAEFFTLKSLAVAGIERPFFFALEMLHDVLKKTNVSETPVLSTAVLAML